MPDGDYYDATGKKYKNSTNLKPYASLVLIKDAGQKLMQVSTDKVAQDISLQANLVNSTASLTSSTTSDLTWDVDNQKKEATYYEVERSADGVHYQSVGNVSVRSAAAASPMAYQFHDQNPLNGKNYYRISQHDRNGVAAFSSVVVINNLGFRLNPNPAHDVLHLLFDQMVRSTDKLGKEILIRNASGTTVKTINLPSTDNLSKVDIDVASLSRGTYVLSISTDGKTISKTFLKQ